MNIFYLYFIEMSSRREKPLLLFHSGAPPRVRSQATDVDRTTGKDPGFTGRTPAIVNKRSDYNKSLRKPNIGGKLRRKTKKYHKKSKKRVRKCKKCRGTQKRR